MLFDHVGAFLYPSLLELRVIGRIAFPIFAYQLTVGYSMSPSKKDYFLRFIYFGLIAQVPYYFLREEFKLNILFALALGVFALWSLEKEKYYYFLLIVPVSFFVEYSVYGLLVILIFHIFEKKPVQFALFILASLLYSLYWWWLQMLAFLALFFIAKPFLGIKLPRNLFYVFFPAHLLIILLIKIIFFARIE